MNETIQNIMDTVNKKGVQSKCKKNLKKMQYEICERYSDYYGVRSPLNTAK